jgi:hypothetical protein
VSKRTAVCGLRQVCPSEDLFLQWLLIQTLCIACLYETGAFAKDHHTLVETRAERVARGMPVQNLAGGGTHYAAMGGLTHFSSLASAHDRAAAQVRTISLYVL